MDPKFPPNRAIRSSKTSQDNKFGSLHRSPSMRKRSKQLKIILEDDNESNVSSRSFWPFQTFPPESACGGSQSTSPLQTGSTPLTPSTSDDEFSTRVYNPGSTKPLVNKKLESHNGSNILSTSPPLPINSYNGASEETTSPTHLSLFIDDDLDESDPECEWYSREFSKILTFGSPIPPSFPSQTQVRPESLLLDPIGLPSHPSVRRRPLNELFSPPTNSSKTASRTSVVIPKYPPPPVPSGVVHLHSRASLRRAPPQSSVPADFEFGSDDDEDEDTGFTDDSSSSFSFSMYEIDLDREPENFDFPTTTPSLLLHQPATPSPLSKIFEGHDVSFDQDSALMFPASLPATPVDFEVDLPSNKDKECPKFVLGDINEVQKTNVIQQASQTAEVDDLSSPLSPFFSYSTDPSTKRTQSPYNEEQILNSKWSTSTLAFVREEREQRRVASSKFKQYFVPSPTKTKHLQPSSIRSPISPTSPFITLLSPKKASQQQTSPLSPRNVLKRRGGQAREGSNPDAIVIGHGVGVGVRKRASHTTISDAGSEESTSSSSSLGLRRKPIPIEMFLRKAA